MSAADTCAVPVELSIGGMTCEGCVRTVTRVLLRVPGVTGAQVDLAGGRARIAGSASARELVAAVQAAGFEAAPGVTPLP
jgi:copper chaperone CopZ